MACEIAYVTSFLFSIVCFISYFIFTVAVLPYRHGVVYYHILKKQKTRIPGVLLSFRIGIVDLFVHKGQKSHTPTSFGKSWTTPGERCIIHASSKSMTPV